MHLPYLLTVILIVDYTVGTSIPRRNCEQSGNCHDESQVPSKLLSPVLKNINFVICPGGEGMCPSETTCCKLKIGVWGCCPLPKAVCCSDGEHCCPHGYTCDIAKNECNNGSTILKIFSKKPATQINLVVCPGGKTECPDGFTCCKSKSGEWGCCPLPNAVCCSDGEHCCPHGYTCDVAAGKCNKGSQVLNIFSKKPASQIKIVTCPGGQQECPDGTTCCKSSSGIYGCCPLPNAVCCSDGEHCCPQGFTCDVAQRKCVRDRNILNIFSKIPATQIKSIICPGRQECPDGNTCCKLESGEYGCCPLPNAVCCSDGEHCCPQGYTCDVSAGTCLIGLKTVRYFPKQPAVKVANEHFCPDDKHVCPEDQTCCKIPGELKYGCCPYSKGTCCRNSRNCCPHGYECNSQGNACMKMRNLSKMFSQEPAVTVKKTENARKKQLEF